MAHERAAVVAAVQSTDNLNQAARELGASRRTLQNRMREYGLPYGQAGRRKQELPKRTSSSAGSTALLAFVCIGALAAGAWWHRRKTTVLGSDALSLSSYWDGLDKLS